jgi:arabinose-5-phosphate isomerase
MMTSDTEAMDARNDGRAGGKGDDVAGAEASELAAIGARAVALECEGLKALEAALRDGLGKSFAAVVRLIHDLAGRVILTGMGKSGHVARKVAATLASTGTPAFFVHPAEASHGDLGMIQRGDAVIMISNSGETPELAAIIDYVKKRRIPLIAMTAREKSALARHADHLLLLPASREACPIGLAPTTSTTMQMALGDALAATLLQLRGFTEEQFRDFHPGGNLGDMLRQLGEIMHVGEELPLVAQDTRMSEVLLVMTGRRFGTAGIVDDSGRLVGIITDGDLRRSMAERPDLLALTAADVMTRDPKTLPPETLAGAAIAFMNRHKITVVFVTDEKGRPLGIVHMHDLVRLERGAARERVIGQD